MPFFADKDHGAHGLGGVVQTPAHVELIGQALNLAAQIVLTQAVAGELHAHEKQARGVVVVLRRFFDVAVALQQKARHGVHDARSVGAGQIQNVCSHVHIVGFVHDPLSANLSPKVGGTPSCSWGWLAV
jgi:hypothetical protein